MAQLFDENLHPRGHGGLFRRKGFLSKLAGEAKKLDASKHEAVELPDGVGIQAKPERGTNGVTKRRFEVRINHGGSVQSTHDTVEEAAKAAARHSSTVKGDGTEDGPSGDAPALPSAVRDLDPQAEFLGHASNGGTVWHVVTKKSSGSEQDRAVLHRNGEIRTATEADLKGASSTPKPGKAERPMSNREILKRQRGGTLTRAQADKLREERAAYDTANFKPGAAARRSDRAAAKRAEKAAAKEQTASSASKAPSGSGSGSSPDVGDLTPDQHKAEARKHRAKARKAEATGNMTAASAFREKAKAHLEASKGNKPGDLKESTKKAVRDQTTKDIKDRAAKKTEPHPDSLLGKQAARDKARMQELKAKRDAGTITPAERDTLRALQRVQRDNKPKDKAAQFDRMSLAELKDELKHERDNGRSTSDRAGLLEDAIGRKGGSGLKETQGVEQQIRRLEKQLNDDGHRVPNQRTGESNAAYLKRLQGIDPKANDSAAQTAQTTKSRDALQAALPNGTVKAFRVNGKIEHGEFEVEHKGKQYHVSVDQKHGTGEVTVEHDGRSITGERPASSIDRAARAILIHSDGKPPARAKAEVDPNLHELNLVKFVHGQFATDTHEVAKHFGIPDRQAFKLLRGLENKHIIVSEEINAGANGDPRMKDESGKYTHKIWQYSAGDKGIDDTTPEEAIQAAKDLGATDTPYRPNAPKKLKPVTEGSVKSIHNRLGSKALQLMAEGRTEEHHKELQARGPANQTMGAISAHTSAVTTASTLHRLAQHDDGMERLQAHHDSVVADAVTWAKQAELSQEQNNVRALHDLRDQLEKQVFNEGSPSVRTAIRKRITAISKLLDMPPGVLAEAVAKKGA